MNSLPDSRVEIQFRSAELEPSDFDQLIEVFEPLAVTSKVQRSELAIKALDAIDVVLRVGSIVGDWAARRYILNPLADSLEKWWQGISSVRKKTGGSWNITASFKDLEIQAPDISDPEMLRDVWQYFVRSLEICHQNAIVLDRIRMVSNGENGLLVIGYQGSRPTHVLDLEDKTIREIEPVSPETQREDLSVGLWYVEQLIKRRDHLTMLVRRGFAVNEEKISELEFEIKAKIAELGLG